MIDVTLMTKCIVLELRRPQALTMLAAEDDNDARFSEDFPDAAILFIDLADSNRWSKVRAEWGGEREGGAVSLLAACVGEGASGRPSEPGPLLTGLRSRSRRKCPPWSLWTSSTASLRPSTT